MSQSMLKTVPLAPTSVARVATRVASKRHVALRVASLDSVASQMEAAGVDKADAYARFEELLGSADVSFNQGDKVRHVQPKFATCDQRRTTGNLTRLCPVRTFHPMIWGKCPTWSPSGV